MGRKFVFDKPRLTTIQISQVDAVALHMCKLGSEPLYRTVARLLREHNADKVRKAKALIERESQKKGEAQTRLLVNASTFNDDIQDKNTFTFDEIVEERMKIAGCSWDIAKYDINEFIKEGRLKVENNLITIVK